MIVLDGRNDREKLTELLAAGEQTHLDYKEILDLTQAKDKLNLVKDLVVLSNRPGGGYLLVGVKDDGTPCTPTGTLDRKRFDGANLGQLVRGYIEGQVHINSQVYEFDDGNEVIVIQVDGHRDGLPVPLAKLGQYTDPTAGRQVVVFRPGDVPIREGSQNVPLRHSHWADILKEHDRLIRAQALENSQELIREIVSQMRTGGVAGAPVAPLTVGMDQSAFGESVLLNFESGSAVRIKQFLHQARQTALSPASEKDAVEEALDRIAELAALGIYYEHLDEAKDAIDALYSIYLDVARKFGPAQDLVAILARVYCLGSLAVRLGQGTMVNHIVQKPVSVPAGDSYVYSSWLRHGQVEGSRKGLFPKGKGGMLISQARDLAATHPSLRPDVPDEIVVPAENLDHDDVLLNSLCQFDLAYCVIARAEGDGQAKGYPTCAAFHELRSAPLMEIIASDDSVRADLFPESSDEAVAQALLDVVSMAEKESWGYGGHWDGLTPAAQRFVTEHRAGS